MKRYPPIEGMTPNKAAAPDRRPLADLSEAEQSRWGGGR